ncbi:MAG: hypothetical protein WAV38_31695, partial [Xanthobacteraceae bacterium]
MSEQTNTETDYTAPIGQPSPGGDYREMVPGNPMPKEDLPDEVFGSDQTGIEQAANEVAARREETREERQAKKPLQREYQQQAGEHRGEPSPVHEILSPEQAAFELNAVRQGERALEADEATRQAVADLDAQANLDQAQADVAQPQPEEQPQQQPVDPDADIVEALQKNPRLMAAIQEQQQQQAAFVEQARQQYLAGLSQNAQLCLAATVSQFSELRGVSDVSQIPLIVNAVAQSNPQRAQAMTAMLQETSRLAQQAQAANAQYQQEAVTQYRQQWDRAVKVDDDNYQKWIDQVEPSPERQQEISRTARQILKESGMSDQQMAYE